jgi:LmbE family N-acetylglucosaminyl deacetylase
MNPYLRFVTEQARLMREARGHALGGLPPAARPAIAPDAPRALIFAPHPDDECIVGALPLRLLREARMNVVNVAVTQGSNKQRQGPRLDELRAACEYLGFGLITTAPGGLERINPNARAQDPAHWRACVEAVTRILAEHRPRVVLVPHEGDWNSTHIGTHLLVADALAAMPADLACHVVETEFWGAMAAPNLMVESSVEQVADLVAATSFHVGEVKRNPYHLLLPAWMQDNVRRGGELVGGQGGAAPDFTFATLYRLGRARGGGRIEPLTTSTLVSAGDDMAALFR